MVHWYFLEGFAETGNNGKLNGLKRTPLIARSDGTGVSHLAKLVQVLKI